MKSADHDRSDPGAPLRAPANGRIEKVEKLWGAPMIANVLGVSEDTVKKWARDPNIPIYQPKGYFALRSELERWLRTKPESSEG